MGCLYTYSESREVLLVHISLRVFVPIAFYGESLSVKFKGFYVLAGAFGRWLFLAPNFPFEHPGVDTPFNYPFT